MTGAGERKDTEVKKSEVDFMDIKILDTKENQVKFLVKGTNPAFANALRRTMMAGLNILAVEDVHFYQNTSVMFDEMLAHRLAMIPLKMDSKKYKAGEKVKLVLEKEGPCTVYSKDIKSTDPKIDISDKKIPIVKLGKGQSIKIEMDAAMHSGKEHAKWQPAVVAYQEVASLECTKDCNECEECIKTCPQNILEIKAKKITITDPYACILCKACEEACKTDALKITVEPDTYVFTIETQGMLESKECFLGATGSLKNKAKEFEKLLSKIE